MNQENCPCCSNHCSKDNLGCGQGREYFSNQDINKDKEPTSLSEQVISALRRCGHLLHHNRNLDVHKMLADFSEDELNSLHELLNKIYSNIKQ